MTEYRVRTRQARFTVFGEGTKENRKEGRNKRGGKKKSEREREILGPE